jgi:5'(3')-deoxyribonucleotidase
MVRRLRIGIDIDDVLVDFISAFREEAEKVLGRELPHVAEDWAFSNWNITNQERNQIWDSVTATPYWFLKCKPFPDVREGLEELVGKHELYFITSKPDTAGATAQQQSQILLRDELGIYCPTVIVTRRKGPIAEALGLNAFIDDRDTNLLNILEYSPMTRRFLRNMPHNSKLQGWIGQRVNSFTEFVEEIRKLEVG